MKVANTTQLGFTDQHHRLFMIQYKIGDHPRVCDLMSGVFNQRAPQPKCTFIWDVEVVLEYLTNLPENNLLSDKTITFQLVHWLALISIPGHQK